MMNCPICGEGPLRRQEIGRLQGTAIYRPVLEGPENLTNDSTAAMLAHTYPRTFVECPQCGFLGSPNPKETRQL